MPEKQDSKFSTATNLAGSSAAGAISALFWLTLAQFVTLTPEYLIVGLIAMNTLLTWAFPKLGKK